MIDNRKCHRLDKVAIEFKDLKEGDLFTLEDNDSAHEDGTVINLASGEVFETDDGHGNPTHGIKSDEVGLTIPVSEPVHPEAIGWMETARRCSRDLEYISADRDKLLKRVFEGGDKHLIADLVEEGYDKLLLRPLVTRLSGADFVVVADWDVHGKGDPVLAKDQVRTYVELRGIKATQSSQGKTEELGPIYYCFDVYPGEGIRALELLACAARKWGKEGVMGAMRGDLKAPAYLDVGGDELIGGLCGDEKSAEAPSDSPGP